jgi:hypothetical protein
MNSPLASRLRTVEESLEGSRQAGPVKISDAADSTGRQGHVQSNRLDLHQVGLSRAGRGSHSEQVKTIDGSNEQVDEQPAEQRRLTRLKSRAGFSLE